MKNKLSDKSEPHKINYNTVCIFYIGSILSEIWREEMEILFERGFCGWIWKNLIKKGLFMKEIC